MFTVVKTGLEGCWVDIGDVKWASCCDGSSHLVKNESGNFVIRTRDVRRNYYFVDYVGSGATGSGSGGIGIANLAPGDCISGTVFCKNYGRGERVYVSCDIDGRVKVGKQSAAKCVSGVVYDFVVNHVDVFTLWLLTG